MATNCLSINSGFAGSLCRNSAGGVARFYIANVADINSVDVSTDGTISDASIDTLYAYVPYIDSASWTETVNVAPENGTIYYEQVANMVMGANEQALRNIVERLGHAGNIVVIVLDNNDRYWLIGDYTGKKLTYMSGGNSNSGTAFGDRNGWEVNITCKNNKPAVEIVLGNDSDLADTIAAADAVVDGNGTGE